MNIVSFDSKKNILGDICTSLGSLTVVNIVQLNDNLWSKNLFSSTQKEAFKQHVFWPVIFFMVSVPVTLTKTYISFN